MQLLRPKCLTTCPSVALVPTHTSSHLYWHLSSAAAIEYIRYIDQDIHNLHVVVAHRFVLSLSHSSTQGLVKSRTVFDSWISWLSGWAYHAQFWTLYNHLVSRRPIIPLKVPCIGCFSMSSPCLGMMYPNCCNFFPFTVFKSILCIRFFFQYPFIPFLCPPWHSQYVRWYPSTSNVFRSSSLAFHQSSTVRRHIVCTFMFSHCLYVYVFSLYVRLFSHCMYVCFLIVCTFMFSHCLYVYVFSVFQFLKR